VLKVGVGYSTHVEALLTCMCDMVKVKFVTLCMYDRPCPTSTCHISVIEWLLFIGHLTHSTQHTLNTHLLYSQHTLTTHSTHTSLITHSTHTYYTLKPLDTHPTLIRHTLNTHPQHTLNTLITLSTHTYFTLNTHVLHTQHTLVTHSTHT